MTIKTSELLQRLSTTLRSEIAPAIGEEYPKTQAFMASVVLARLAKQVALAPEHSVAEQSDLELVHSQLDDLLADVSVPATLTDAVNEARSKGTVAALAPVIEAIYAWGVDNPSADAALAAIRVALRRDIDRRMEIAT